MDLKQFLSNINENQIFSVQFIKKDGTVRDMVARLHVKKGVKGVGLAFNPFEKGLLPVFDMQKQAFRMINLKTIKRVKSDGQEVVLS
jgi:hypothetical protein